MDIKKTESYKEGAAAFRTGLSAGDNPHPKMSEEHKIWSAGFIEARVIQFKKETEVKDASWQAITHAHEGPSLGSDAPTWSDKLDANAGNIHWGSSSDSSTDTSLIDMVSTHISNVRNFIDAATDHLHTVEKFKEKLTTRSGS